MFLELWIRQKAANGMLLTIAIAGGHREGKDPRYHRGVAGIKWEMIKITRLGARGEGVLQKSPGNPERGIRGARATPRAGGWTLCWNNVAADAPGTYGTTSIDAPAPPPPSFLPLPPNQPLSGPATSIPSVDQGWNSRRNPGKNGDDDVVAILLSVDDLYTNKSALKARIIIIINIFFVNWEEIYVLTRFKSINLIFLILRKINNKLNDKFNNNNLNLLI